jgi:hypothetical protein
MRGGCPDQVFAGTYNFMNLCPASTVVGMAMVTTYEPAEVGYVPVPVFNLPTQCAASVTGDSWLAPGRPSYDAGPVAYTLPEGLDGCNRLGVSPEVQVSPDVANTSTPSGLDVNVRVPQVAALNPTGVAESSVKKIEVALPDGVTLNPGGAGGLQACALLTGRSGGQEALEAEGKISGIDRETPKPANCPQQSKIAPVAIHTPLLPNPLEGGQPLHQKTGHAHRVHRAKRRGNPQEHVNNSNRLPQSQAQNQSWKDQED